MRTFLLVILVFTIVCGELLAQQLRLGGNPFISVPGGPSAQNTFVGINAGVDNSSGVYNTFLGSFAGRYNVGGLNNTFIGANAGNGNTGGSNNTFVGLNAGAINVNGANNTFIGASAGRINVGQQNAFMGFSAGYNNSQGIQNAFIGSGAGFDNSTGNGNTFLGTNAGSKNTTGTGNVFIGFFVGQGHTAGSYNTLIGYGADVSSQTLTNASAIGYNAKVSVDNAIVLGDPNNTSMKVGIGTDSPQFPLDVRGIINLRNRGTIKFSHLSNPNLRNGATDQFLTVNEQGETVMAQYRISIGDAGQWADKVFAPGYRLRSLAQVEAYTQQHGHLPGVPSAQEVAREGADVAKLTATLLEKIEELTLYTIQLEKNNRQQRAELDELKRVVGNLKK